MESAVDVCARFRTKAMVHKGEYLVRSPETLAFPYCWCTRTSSDIGPDQGLVTLSRCRNRARACFEPLPEDSEAGQTLCEH